MQWEFGFRVKCKITESPFVFIIARDLFEREWIWFVDLRPRHTVASRHPTLQAAKFEVNTFFSGGGEGLTVHLFTNVCRPMSSTGAWAFLRNLHLVWSPCTQPCRLQGDRIKESPGLWRPNINYWSAPGSRMATSSLLFWWETAFVRNGGVSRLESITL